jgi:NHL repeat
LKKTLFFLALALLVAQWCNAASPSPTVTPTPTATLKIPLLNMNQSELSSWPFGVDKLEQAFNAAMTKIDAAITDINTAITDIDAAIVEINAASAALLQTLQSGLLPASDGPYLYVADISYQNVTMQRLSATNDTPPVRIITVTFGNFSQAPTEVAVDSHGNVFTDDNQNWDLLFYLNSQGAPATGESFITPHRIVGTFNAVNQEDYWYFGSSNSGAGLGLAVDSRDTVWATPSYGSDAIIGYTTSQAGDVTPAFVLDISADITQQQGLFIDAHDNFWLAGRCINYSYVPCIAEYPPDTTPGVTASAPTKLIVDTVGDDNTQLGSGNDPVVPQQVSLDPTGNIWVTTPAGAISCSGEIDDVIYSPDGNTSDFSGNSTSQAPIVGPTTITWYEVGQPGNLGTTTDVDGVYTPLGLLTSGTIDHATGAVTLHFSSPPDGIYPYIFIDYTGLTTCNGALEFDKNASGDAAPIASIAGDQTGLSSPTGIAIAPNGDVWIADTGMSGVGKWSAGHTGNLAPDAVLNTQNTSKTQISEPFWLVIK